MPCSQSGTDEIKFPATLIKGRHTRGDQSLRQKLSLRLVPRIQTCLNSWDQSRGLVPKILCLVPSCELFVGQVPATKWKYFIGSFYFFPVGLGKKSCISLYLESWSNSRLFTLLYQQYRILEKKLYRKCKWQTLIDLMLWMNIVRFYGADLVYVLRLIY